jgi:hypothetical protein
MKKGNLVVGTVNGTNIFIIEDKEKLVPIKPICEALGVDYSTQLQRIKDDPILSSTVGLSPTVGADGKNREMQCLPIKYVFGWLFRIDSRNVKEEAKESVVQYQILCYDILYNHFQQYHDFVEERQMAIDEQLRILDESKKKFKFAKDVMAKADRVLKELRGVVFQDFMINPRQYDLIFEANDMEVPEKSGRLESETNAE